MYYVYILQSEKTGRYYIGSSNNISRRLQEHNAGQTASLSYQRPLKVVFYQGYDNMKIARGIERRLKKLKSRVIIEHIIREGKIKLGP